jgi:hypothetical protein
MVVRSGVPIVVVTHGLPIGVITCGVRFWTSRWEIIAIQIIFIRIYIMDYIAFLKHQMNLSNFMSWMSMCKSFLLIEVNFHILLCEIIHL